MAVFEKFYTTLNVIILQTAKSEFQSDPNNIVKDKTTCQ